MATTYPVDRFYKVTTADNGNFLEFGTGSPSGVGTLSFQFIPSQDWDGSFAVLGRGLGPAAKAAGAPFVQLSYRRVNVNGLASDWAFSTATITGEGIIQVPSNGLSIGLLTSCNAGSCILVPWDLNGSGAV